MKLYKGIKPIGPDKNWTKMGVEILKKNLKTKSVVFKLWMASEYVHSSFSKNNILARIGKHELFDKTLKINVLSAITSFLFTLPTYSDQSLPKFVNIKSCFSRKI